MKPYQRHCTWGERLLTLHSFQETNIDAFAMSFSQEPFPEEKSALNIARHGKNSPFDTGRRLKVIYSSFWTGKDIKI